MTLTDEDFRRLVIAEPRNDQPRMEYADWLEEQGQTERAEFIRVQCELAPYIAARRDEGEWMCRSPVPTRDGLGSAGCGKCRPCVCVRRERELWGDPGDRTRLLGLPPGWLATIVPSNFPGLSAGWLGTVLVQRGFVKAVCASLSAFWGERECPKCNSTREKLVDSGLKGVSYRILCVCRVDRSMTEGPTPALAELVRREPVERVVTTDGLESPYGDYGHFYWSRSVTEALKLKPLYDSEDAANLDFSRALIDIARNTPEKPS